MAKEISIAVKNKIARVADGAVYVCGNSDFVVVFDFDEEWDAFPTKTARFIHSGRYTDIVFDGNRCAVPIISNTLVVTVGVFAGNLATTTPAHIRAKKSVLCGGGVPAAPENDVYNQIMDMLNDLATRIEAPGNGGYVPDVPDDNNGVHADVDCVWIGTEQDYAKETISSNTIYFITDEETNVEPSGVQQIGSALYVLSDVVVSQSGNTLMMGG